MSRLGPIGGPSRESESLREASVRNSRLQEVIVGAVVREVAQVVDSTALPPRDPDEIVDSPTPILPDGALYEADPENPFAND